VLNQAIACGYVAKVFAGCQSIVAFLIGLATLRDCGIWLVGALAGEGLADIEGAGVVVVARCAKYAGPGRATVGGALITV
jgi:hypothetical protein